MFSIILGWCAFTGIMLNLLLNPRLPILQDLRSSWRVYPTLDNSRGKSPLARMSRMKNQKMKLH